MLEQNLLIALIGSRIDGTMLAGMADQEERGMMIRGTRSIAIVTQYAGKLG